LTEVTGVYKEQYKMHTKKKYSKPESYQAYITSGPLAVRLSWLENDYSHPLMGGFGIFSSKLGND